MGKRLSEIDNLTRLEDAYRDSTDLDVKEITALKLE